MRLTSAGEALVAPARRTLQDFEDAEAVVHNVEGLRSGRLVVVAPPYLAADPLARLLGAFHERYPDVSISIVDPSQSDVVTVLRSRGAHIGLDFDAPDAPGVNSSRLADEEVMAVMPPGTATAGPAIPMSALDDVRLISPSVPDHLPVMRRIRTLGLNASTGVVTAHRVAAVPLVLAGLGATLLTEPLARSAEASGAVACRFDPPIHRRAFLIHVPPVTSSAARAFLALVAETEAPGEAD